MSARGHHGKGQKDFKFAKKTRGLKKENGKRKIAPGRGGRGRY